MITAVLATVIGILLVLTAMVDVFQTLFHPSGGGAMSDWTALAIWKIFRSLAEHARGVLTFAGPVAILAIICLWAVFTIVGFGLIYWPHLPTSFVAQTGIPSTRWAQLPTALSTSADALITLSEGVNARPPWLQSLRALEAVVGFGLLTASVSWLLSLYPVLETRRTVAHKGTLMHEAERMQSVDIVKDGKGEVAGWFFTMAGDLAILRNQVAQFPIAQFFYIGEKKSALAGVLPYLAELADRAGGSASPSLRVAGTMMGGAVRDFALLIADRFLDVQVSDTREILTLYAREQMYEPVIPVSQVAPDRRKLV
jgi:hypothetical protein